MRLVYYFPEFRSNMNKFAIKVKWKAIQVQEVVAETTEDHQVSAGSSAETPTLWQEQASLQPVSSSDRKASSGSEMTATTAMTAGRRKRSN